MKRLGLPSILLLIAVAGVAVLLPGSSGPFLLDDFSNIVDNPALQADDWNWETTKHAVLTNTSGLLKRPVSMLSFVANAATFGLTPFSLKLTNLLLHGLTAILVTLLALRLFEAAQSGLAMPQRRLAAILAGLIWSVHPVAVTSTLYVVQRMNLLATLFTVAALLAWCHARPWFFRSPPRTMAWLGLAVLLWLLGILSKENALLLPVYVVLLEWLVFNFEDHTGRQRVAWKKIVLGTTVAGLLLATTVLALSWDRWDANYALRDFSLIERLLTEARVLWQYIGMVLLPGHGRLGLFLDDVTLSTGLFTPPATFFALIGLAGVVAMAVLVRRRLPLASFGLLFFLAGHLLESTVFPLEIAFEHRNYLPAFGLIVAVIAGLQYLAGQVQLRTAAWLSLAAFSLFLALFTVIRSLHWADELLLAQLEAFHHPGSARAQTQLGSVYTSFAHRARAQDDAGWTKFYFEEAVTHYKDAMAADPNNRNALLLWFTNAQILGQPFPDSAYQELLRRLRSGLPTADTPSHLDQLFRCLAGGCEQAVGQFDEILHAALENPRLRGRTRSEVMVVAAKYFRDVRREPEWALYWLARAADDSPEHPRFRIFLARQLLAMNRQQEALEELRKVTATDTFGVYDQQAEEIREAITQARLVQH